VVSTISQLIEKCAGHDRDAMDSLGITTVLTVGESWRDDDESSECDLDDIHVER
jgi:hypothetical protein